MAKYSSAAALAALVSTTYAAVCQNITIPVNISARNGVFNVTNPTNNIESTNFALRMARQGNNYTQESLTGYNTVSGSYEIEATYCKPDSGSSKVLQILTHGIGFDRSYWNLPYNNYNYSYTSVAVDQYGYDTLAIDRLGIGQSTLFTDPIQEGQLWLEVAALAQVTMDARNGQVGGMGCNAEKFVHVGHSFGSAITYTLTSMYPNITDGQILTGFSQNGSFASQFILGSNLIIANQISALSQYTTGYLAPNAVEGVQIDFFAPGDFDPNILTYAYMTGQPVTPGEILTLTGATAKPNTFSGPSLVITGEHDTPYCGGDCLATGNPALASIPAASAMFLPNASPFEAFIVPGAGHGLNLQYTHPITYQTMLNFLTQNGLASK